MRSQSLYQRLFAPFVAILLVSTLVALLVTHLLYSRVALSHLESQILYTVDVLARGHFPLTPDLLRTLSRLTGTGFVIRGEGGDVEQYGEAAAGVDPGDLEPLLPSTMAAQVGPILADTGGIQCQGRGLVYVTGACCGFVVG